MNEFSFLKNAHVFGLDVICENADVLAGEVVTDDDDARGGGQRGVRWGSVQGKTGGPSGPAVCFPLKG